MCKSPLVIVCTVAALVSLGSAALGASTATTYLSKPPEWFQSDEGRRVTANILSYQSVQGGWPKNTDTTGRPYAGSRDALHGTFDNGATTDELRCLAKAWNATHTEEAKTSFLAGLDHILQAQYPSGGWPQFYPPGKKYHRHITYNDNAMVRLMIFLREVATSPDYTFVPADKKVAAKGAFDRGVACILKCQIVENGKLTAWCAQHDEIDYSPRPGRSYELASLSGLESVGITSLLMSLEDPSPEIMASVEGAIEWFRRVAILGIRVEKQNAGDGKEKDMLVFKDPSAPSVWARFYELKTGRPMFCDRDGVVKYDLAEISTKRRGGYSWYGSHPQKLLEQEYPEWKARLAD